jgi:hypothetical protein
MYKLTYPDGYDFYSHTINYRAAIGTIVRVTDYGPPEHGPCGRGLHASGNPNDCFVGASIPCAAFRVKGIQKLAGDRRKSRYQALKVIDEIYDLDKLFGWKYSEAVNPINPFKINPPEIRGNHIQLLKKWALVHASVWNSVWASVSDSVWDSALDYVRDSVRNSIGASVAASVRASAWDSVRAYISSLFPNIKKWKYIDHKPGVNPFQPAVDLWRMGLISSFDGTIWRLHGGSNGRVLWQGNI